MNRGLLNKQKSYFNKNYTKDYEFRHNQLEKLYKSIKNHEDKLLESLKQDLGKNEVEAYVTEIGLIYRSIKYFQKKLKPFMKPQRTKNEIILFPDKGYIHYEPLGSVLIIGPFNYPVQTTLEPLVGALAAGNCVVVKPSEKTPNVSSVLQSIIETTFDEEYIAVVQGDKETTSELIHLPFDFIFFTGSNRVGKIVMKAASHNLIPVCLELGGKSPAIVDKHANLKQSAERIVWAKFTNAGQTCVAPDYVLVEKSVKKKFFDLLIDTINKFYKDKKYYGKIIDIEATKRLVDLIESDRVFRLHGGTYNLEDNYIEPTVLDLEFNDIELSKSMVDEIFGPILPVISYDNSTEMINYIKGNPKPLALYLFTKNKSFEKKILNEISFGSGGINTALIQVSSTHLPFGGVGDSGIGSYHGKHSFELFSHKKAVVKTRFRLSSVNIMYPPYNKLIKVVKKILS